MTNTTNYNLKKPATSDYYNVQDQNDNMDIIDAALKPTADPAQVPSGNVGKLVQWVSWIANRIKAITGGTNWYDDPPITLAEADNLISTLSGNVDVIDADVTELKNTVPAALDKLLINDLLMSLQLAANSANIDAWCDLLGNTSMIDTVNSSNYLVTSGQLKANDTFSGGSSGTNTMLGYDTYSYKFSQAFTPTVSGQLKSVTITMYKSGSPTDNLICELYTASGGVPTGSVLASATIAMTSLPTSASAVTITFGTPYSLVAGQVYCIVLSRSGSVSSSNYVMLPLGSTANGFPSSMYKYGPSAWSDTGKYFNMSYYVSVVATVIWQSVNASEILNRMAVAVNQALNTSGIVSWSVSDDGINWVDLTNTNQMYDTGFDATSVYLKCVIQNDATVSAVAWGGI